MNRKNMRKHSKTDFIESEQSQSKARSTTLSDTEVEKDGDGCVFGKCSSPIFNIHIHLPYYDSNSSKLFLPKVQPIINLHFDELGRQLEGVTQKKNKKFIYKTVNNLVTNIVPKFGVVKFHCKNDSKERDGQESNMITETPNSSQKHSSDMKLNKNNSEKDQNVITETYQTTIYNNSENKTSKSNSNNNCNSHASTSYELSKDIKLKKAVVVLTDVCKSENYKHFFESESYKNQNNKNEFSNNFADKSENNFRGKEKYEAEKYSIKVENEFYKSESFTSECSKVDSDASENCSVSADVNLQTEKDTDNKYNIEKICITKHQNFTALVEGWNFSDILKRFQTQHSKKYGNLASNSINENKSGKYDIDDDKNEPSHEFYKKVKENEFIEEEDLENSDNKLNLEINKTEIDLNEKDFFNKNLSDTAESFSFLQYQNESKNDSLLSELDVLNEDSVHKFKEMTKGDIEPKFTSSFDDSDLDESEIISGKEMSSRSIVDMEVIENDLSDIRSNAVQENKFEVPETNKSSLSPRFDLELMGKEMQRRTLSLAKTQQNLKSKKSDVESSSCGSTSSPKKMKLSDGKPEISEQNTKTSSKVEDFIRLNSSGPTEFSVASLNKIKPSESAAKDFKRKMLFGNRVNRFSSPDQLRIYQLKKEAARKSINQ